MFGDYFHALLARYISLYVQPSDSVVEVDPVSSYLSAHFTEAQTVFLRGETPSVRKESAPANKADYVVLNGILHYERDIQAYLKTLAANCFGSMQANRNLLQQFVAASDKLLQP